ncbi:MAG: GNAT family N-acetyltransferase [Acidobacteriota bacterium]
MPEWIETVEVALKIKPYAPTDASRWDAFVGSQPTASLCHTSGWQRVIEQTWKHRQHSLYAEHEGEISGVLPLFHVKGWFGSMLISTPNGVYGGAVANDAASHQALIEAAKSLAVELNVDYLELRDAARPGCAVLPGCETRPSELLLSRGSCPEIPQAGGAAYPGELVQNLYVSFDRPIVNDEVELMRSFPRDVRRMIRLGEKHGLSSLFGREELLGEFYELYAASVRRLGTPVFPKKMFAEFLRQFPDCADILVIRDGLRTVASVMSFYFRETVMPYYSGANPAYHRAGVNNFMYRELMLRSAQRGFIRFDFGRSKLGTGACEFKRGWRMTERVLPYKFFLVRADKMPNLNPTNPKFNLMIETWKRLPLWLTKLIGPKIVRNFP